MKPNSSFSEDTSHAYSRFYSLLVRILIYSYAISCFSFVTADPDIWGHIKFGETTWASGALAAVDPYSYTARGLPWLNHEWLTEIIFYLTYAAWGSTGLLVFKLAVGLLVVHLLTCLYWSQGKSEFIYLAYFLILIPALAPGFMVRPQLLTYLFLTLLIFLLYKFFAGNQRALAWTPPLMLVWVNCHGGVVAGAGIYGIVVICELVRGAFTGEKQGRLLAGYFALSCVALLLNPYGYELWIFFYKSISLPREISEWNPINLWDTSFLQYKVLTLLFLGMLWPFDRKRLWAVLIILIAVYFGFKHQRHSILAAIVMAPFVSCKLTQWINKIFHGRGIETASTVLKSLPAGKNTLLSPASRTMISLSLIFFIAFELFQAFNHYRINNFKIQVDPKIYPVYVVQFMKANRINGNVLVPFDWGEYLIWHLPESRVSIDGRFRTVYPEKVIQENLEFSMGSKGWRALVDNFATDIILVRKPDPIQPLLKTATDWNKVYEDWNSVLYLRTPPADGPEPHHGRNFIHPTTSPSFEFP